jgi:hypothetical protein
VGAKCPKGGEGYERGKEANRYAFCLRMRSKSFKLTEAIFLDGFTLHGNRIFIGGAGK